MNLFFMQGNEEKNDENEERLTLCKNKKNKRPISFLVVNKKNRRKDDISGLLHVNLTLVTSTIVLGAMYLLWHCMEYAMPNINARVNGSFGGDNRRLARWDGNVPPGNICGKGTIDGNRGNNGDSENEDDTNPQSLVQSNLRATAPEFIPRQVSFPQMEMSEAQAMTTDKRPGAMPVGSTGQGSEERMYAFYNPRFDFDSPPLPDEQESRVALGGLSESRFAKFFASELPHGDLASPLTYASIRQYSPWPEALESPHAHHIHPENRPYGEDSDFDGTVNQREGRPEAQDGVRRPRYVPHDTLGRPYDAMSMEVDRQLTRILSSLRENKAPGEAIQPRLDRAANTLAFDVGLMVRAILHRPKRHADAQILQFAFRRAADVQKRNLVNITLLMEMLMAHQSQPNQIDELMVSLYNANSMVEMSTHIKTLGRAILSEAFLYNDTVLHLLICFFKARKKMALHFCVLLRCSNYIKTWISNGNNGIPEGFYFYDGGGWAHNEWFHESMIHPGHYADIVGYYEGNQTMKAIDDGKKNSRKAISDFFDTRHKRNRVIAKKAQDEQPLASILYLPATTMRGTALFLSRLPTEHSLFYMLLHAINMDITPEHFLDGNVHQGAEGGSQDAHIVERKQMFWKSIVSGAEATNTRSSSLIDLLIKLRDGISTQYGNIILEQTTQAELKKLDNFDYAVSSFTSKKTKLSEEQCRLLANVFNQLIATLHHLMQANRILIDHTKQANLPGE